MLYASPAWICVIDSTAVSIGFLLRVISVCRLCEIDTAVMIGSTPLCGIAACAPLPVTVISNSFDDAIIGPAVTPNVPTPAPGQLCIPNTASHGKRSKRPSSIITRAPPPPSSAGWKITWTVPSKRRDSARYCAAASSIAVWPSWPHACIRPSWTDLCANALCSCSGSASMSARRPTDRVDVPADSVPTTPVVASPRSTA